LGPLINPLIPATSYGSFRFSIANDFNYIGEPTELTSLKANVVPQYHNEIFINPLEDGDILKLQATYGEDQVDAIYRPLAKIMGINSPYNVGYFDFESVQKNYVRKIINKQKRKLLTARQVSQESIGELENSIVHKKSSLDGKVSRTTIFREELRSMAWDLRSNLIQPLDHTPIMLTEEILIGVAFDSNNGFTFSFEDLQVEITDVEFKRGLTGFYTNLYDRFVTISEAGSKNPENRKDLEIIQKLLGNSDLLRNLGK
jgi:hypothetical protein